jgi:hypothetical protein
LDSTRALPGTVACDTGREAPTTRWTPTIVFPAVKTAVSTVACWAGSSSESKVPIRLVLSA